MSKLLGKRSINELLDFQERPVFLNKNELSHHRARFQNFLNLSADHIIPPLFALNDFISKSVNNEHFEFIFESKEEKYVISHHFALEKTGRTKAFVKNSKDLEQNFSTQTYFVKSDYLFDLILKSLYDNNIPYSRQYDNKLTKIAYCTPQTFHDINWVPKQSEKLYSKNEAGVVDLPPLIIAQPFTDLPELGVQEERGQFQESINKQLISACKDNNLAEVKRLIEELGADVNYQDKDEEEYGDGFTHLKTALIYAAQEGHTEIVRFLLGLKDDKDKLLVDVGIVNANDEDAFERSVSERQVEVVGLLLGLKDDKDKLLVDINKRNAWGSTALEYVAQNGYIEIVRALLEPKDGKGKLLVDINKQDENGISALMWAVYNCQADVVVTLIEAGADYALKARDPYQKYDTEEHDIFYFANKDWPYRDTKDPESIARTENAIKLAIKKRSDEFENMSFKNKFNKVDDMQAGSGETKASGPP